MTVARRRVVWELVLAGAVACSNDAVEVHPIYVEVGVHDGRAQPACSESGLFDGISVRDVKLTATARREAGAAASCAVPVDGRHERLLLYAMGCSLSGEQPANITFTMIPATGAHALPVTVELGPSVRSATRSFGAGLPIAMDIEVSGIGQASCWFSGMYVRTTSAAKLWGPYRLVSHEGSFTPNEDRR